MKNNKEKACYFCVNGYLDIDYKEAVLLRRYTSSYAKIIPQRKSNLCSKHQRKLSKAIKRARIMALLPFTKK
jgi:small subunit ribosomal protein S18